MTAEREAYWRKTVEHLGRAPEQLLAELDAERAESQRLQSRVEALEGALAQINAHLAAAQLGIDAALHPEPAAPRSVSKESLPTE